MVVSIGWFQITTQKRLFHQTSIKKIVNSGYQVNLKSRTKQPDWCEVYPVMASSLRSYTFLKNAQLSCAGRKDSKFHSKSSFRSLSGWWFQPSTHLKNMLVKMHHLPRLPGRGKNSKMFELPPPICWTLNGLSQNFDSVSDLVLKKVETGLFPQRQTDECGGRGHFKAWKEVAFKQQLGKYHHFSWFCTNFQVEMFDHALISNKSCQVWNQSTIDYGSLLVCGSFRFQIKGKNGGTKKNVGKNHDRRCVRSFSRPKQTVSLRETNILLAENLSEFQ